MPTPPTRVKALALFALALFALPTPVQSQTIHGIALTVEAFRFDYEQGRDFDLKSEDPFYRVGIDYTHDFGGGMFMRFGGRYATGEAKLSVPNFGTASGIDQTIWEARIDVGRDMELDGTLAIAPFIGIHYRRWLDDSTGSVTTGGATPFDREVDQIILPFGVTAFWALGDAWTLSAKAELSILIYGRQKGNSSTLPGITFDLRNQFFTGRGVGGEFLLRRRLNNSLTLAVGPYIRYWDIDNSERDNGQPVVIPANETLEAGVTLKFIFGPI